MKNRFEQKMKLSEQVESSSLKEIKRQEVKNLSFIPSGSTMLNLACSDTAKGAFVLGRITTLPGGSASGKTMLMLTMLAECTMDKTFDNYNLIYDDGEETRDGFDIEYLFGKKLNHRISEKLQHSQTIQDFKMNILSRIKNKESFIYVLDSLDSLSSDEELEKEYKAAVTRAKNHELIKELKGSYKTEKAKIMGETLRIINNQIKYSQSALFIVQQERTNIGVTWGSSKTTSGGMAPFFYSTHQVWLNKKSTITKDIKNQKRKVGHKIIASVKKNKITGKLRDIEFDIYYDYGIDDIQSCIDFLVMTGHWEKTGVNINAFGLSANKSKIIELIEKENLKDELQNITEKVWMGIEDSLRLNRVKKY